MYSIISLFLISVFTVSATPHAQLISQFHEHGIVKKGSFTLRSGATSSFYIDMRMLCSHIDLLQDVASSAVGLIDPDKYDHICGVPYGALPLATAMALTMHKPLLFLRKEVKTYGTQQLLEGSWQIGDRVLLVEDVITSGQSIMEAVEKIEAAGLFVAGIIVIVDREAGGMALLQSKGYHATALLQLHELLV